MCAESRGFHLHEERGKCPSLYPLLCEKSAFCAIIPCSPLLTKVADRIDCLPDVSAAQSSAAAVSDTGLTCLAELCRFFQKQTLLYEFSSQIHYMKKRK